MLPEASFDSPTFDWLELVAISRCNDRSPILLVPSRCAKPELSPSSRQATFEKRAPIGRRSLQPESSPLVIA
jgi:hypothetical protein